MIDVDLLKELWRSKEVENQDLAFAMIFKYGEQTTRGKARKLIRSIDFDAYYAYDSTGIRNRFVQVYGECSGKQWLFKAGNKIQSFNWETRTVWIY